MARLVWPLLAVGFTLSLASVAMEQTISFYYQDRLQLSNQATPRIVEHGEAALFPIAEVLHAGDHSLAG